MAIAIVDPFNTCSIRGAEFAFGGPLDTVIATATEVDQLLATYGEAPHESERGASLIDLDGDAAKLKDLASAEPAIRLLNRLIKKAANARASDIHFEPTNCSVDIRFRIDGVLIRQGSLTKSDGLAALSRLKILGELDIAERRRPQDGRLSVAPAGEPIDLRVSTSPTIHGESAVARLLQTTAKPLSLSDLGFDQSMTRRLGTLIAKPNGILLVTGPTGSGKTTTLYALLQELATADKKILTVEDPVEYKIAGISQTQVNPAIDLTFANAMRSFLRHDPDVILVGEMRDLETARTAVQAALTGHLVLSTLHTNDAPSAITRLLDMGVDDYLVASTLSGVIAQRLVRVTCQECNDAQTARADCKLCGGSGYHGRTVVSELLEIGDEIKPAIRKGVTAAEIRNIASKTAYSPIADDGARLLAGGVTDKAELARVIGA